MPRGPKTKKNKMKQKYIKKNKKAVPGQNSIAVKRYYGTPGRYPGILTYYRLGSKIIRIDGNTPKTSLLPISRGLRGGIGLKGGNLGGKIVPTNEKMTPLKGILYAGSY